MPKRVPQEGDLRTQHKPGTKPMRQVGFYACSGKIVRVKSKSGLRKGETKHRVKCPACKQHHPVSIMWRRAKRGEAIKASFSI